MSTLKERFAELAQEKPEISQADLARATGTKPPSVNGWFSGETKSMKFETATAAAALYGVVPTWLAKGTGPKYATLTAHLTVPAPVLSSNMTQAPVNGSQSAINLDSVLDGLCAALAQAEPAMRDALAGTLASLAKSPDNVQLKDALRTMLTPAAFTQASKKSRVVAAPLPYLIWVNPQIPQKGLCDEMVAANARLFGKGGIREFCGGGVVGVNRKWG